MLAMTIDIDKSITHCCRLATGETPTGGHGYSYNYSVLHPSFSRLNSLY